MSDTPEPEKDPLPTASELLPKVRVADPGRLQAIYSRRFNKQSIEAQLEWEHLEGLRGHYKHKGRWSWFLMAAIGVVDSEPNIRNKLSRGKFTAVFLVQCLEAIGAQEIRL
jgi:hypothetical protein